MEQQATAPYGFSRLRPYGETATTPTRDGIGCAWESAVAPLCVEGLKH